MTRRRLLLTLAVLVVIVTTATTVAFAYFGSGGTGTASGTVGSLSAPTGVTVSATGGTVHVSWDAVTAPASGAVSYSVKRGAVVAGGTCAPAPITATSCDDTGVASGTYTYTVTAHWKGWTATASAAPVTVNAAVLDHFNVSAPSSATAGSPFSVTVSAKDATNNTVPYTGTIHFSSSDSGSPVLPANYTFTSGDNGSHTFTNGVTLKTSGTQTISVNDTVITGTTGQSGSVAVAAASATKLTLSAASTTQTAGAGNNLTIAAEDAFGNAATSYTGSKILTFGGASAIGANNPTVTNSAGTAVDFGTATTIGFTNGVASVAGSNNGVMKLYKAEAATITVSDGSINNNPGLAVTVTAGTVSKLALSAATTTQTAGAANSLTVTAQDAAGNTVTSYAGSKNLTFSGASAIGANTPTVTDSSGTAVNFGTATAIGFTNGVASVAGSNNGVMKLYKAETATITVTDGSINNNPGLGVTVSAAPYAGLQFVDCKVNTGSMVAGPCTNVSGIGNPPGFVQGQVRALDTYGNVATVTSTIVVDITNTLTSDWSASPNSVTINSGQSQSTGTPWKVSHTVNPSSTTTITGRDHANPTTISPASMTATK